MNVNCMFLNVFLCKKGFKWAAFAIYRYADVNAIFSNLLPVVVKSLVNDFCCKSPKCLFKDKHLSLISTIAQ